MPSQLNMNKNSIFISISIILFVTIKIYSQSTKIVSLAPSYTKQIYTLKADSNLIAYTKYGQKNHTNSEKTVVGSVVNISVEKIRSLNPDLILSSTLTRKKQIRRLKKLGLKVHTFQQPQSFADISDQFLRIAEFVNKSQFAQNYLHKIKNKINSLERKIDTKTKTEKNKKIFFQIGRQPLYAVHPNTYLNEVINLLNGQNIIQNRSSGICNRETVISKDPEIIFIALNGKAAELAQQEWNDFGSIAAVKSHQIYQVAPNLFNSPTPGNFYLALKKATKHIYSLKFNHKN